MSPAPCEYLEWDSRFFGVRIGHVRGHCLSESGLAQVKAWGAANRIDCLYFLADPDDPQTLQLAQGGGFQLLDVRVTLECSLNSPSGAPTPAIRMFQPSDAAALKEIAGISHQDSRFYADPRFPDDLCHRLYETWIERSFEGWADAVLVAEAGGAPAGYLSCHRAGDAGSIGLLAVAPHHRGKGLGKQLVEASLGYFRELGLRRATVLTQGRNISSQRLYQRCGFLTRFVQLWYHYWFEAEVSR